MRFNNMTQSLFGSQGISGRPVRQRAVPAILLCLALAACQQEKLLGLTGQDSGFVGMVAADEPKAVTVGRDILSAGGTPADAAVAMAFTLSVTMPSAAGLGGGGSCLVYDHGKASVEALDFSGPLPALARGMFALHAKYGHQHWEVLLTPAETLARGGTDVSRAFARSLAAAPASLLANRDARQIFGGSDGQGAGEGERLVQPELGAVLSRLRIRGVGDFYGGAGAKDLTAAARSVGASFSVEQLQSFLPRWQAPLKLPQGNDSVFFAPPPSVAGPLAAGLWGDAAGQSKAPVGRASGTGFVVMGGDGSTVACALSLGAPFGSGRMIPDTGILLAAGEAGRQSAPILGVNANSNEFRFAVAGGGDAGTLAVLQAARAREVDGKPVAQLLAAIRPIDGNLVNLVACSSGRPDEERCEVANDPRGAGLSAVLIGR